MITVDTSNLDGKGWTQKNELPTGKYPLYLTQSAITRQINFKLTDIVYDWIKDKISRIERGEYNTTIGRNVMNKDYMVDFLHF